MNPIMNMLKPQNSLFGLINAINGNPQAVYNQMLSNPQFAQFVQQNQGKTPEQIAQSYGINMNNVNSLLQQLNIKNK